ncbi:MAG: hypothetical protein LBE92_06560 [Chryseobacterium sp.]|jgi:hypothetical protein|uniref:hypothetical protein n=1 Tax=Chryseobacterium sp. TaxID=1871047 RepID=UPI00282D5F03|nr:hypothetical protein [Chryseobacterium sp.]MDR2235767.1 hypothetical protein [Chryseobacterium sp.]
MKLNHIFPLLLIGKLSFAQKISGTIVTERHTPVTDARIGVENEDIGDMTDGEGRYSLDLSGIAKDKNLKVLVNGYEPFQMSLSEFEALNSYEIILKEKPVEIDKIEITPKKYILKNFGTRNARRAYCGYNSQDTTKLFREYAIKVNNTRKAKIKTIHVNLASFTLEQPVTLIFDVQRSADGFPGESLVNQTLKLTVTKDEIKNNTVSLDVGDQGIWTNEDFFVSVRTAEDFKGRLYIAGNIFAFSKSTYYRNYFGEWKKFSSGEPSINADVLIER